MPPPTYRLQVRTRDDGTVRANAMPFLRLGYSYALNGPGGIDFAVNLTDPLATTANLDPGNTALRLFRQSGNLLTRNQSDAEVDTADITNYGTGVVVSRSTAQAHQGLASFQTVTPGSVTDEGLTLVTTFPPVVVGAVYTYSAWVRPTTTMTLAARIKWRTGAGAFISDTTGPATSCPANTWTFLTVTGAAPATAVTANTRVTTITTAQAGTFFADQQQLEAGPVATWFDQGSGAAEETVWRGYLAACRINGRDELECSGEGLYSLLRHRFIRTDLVYSTGSGQATIARNLLNYTNGLAPTLITLGTDSGTNTVRKVAYCAWECRPISDALEELASADDGFDFEVDQLGNWNTYNPRKGVDLSAGWLLTTDEVDVSNLSYTEDATELATEFAATGPCNECAGDTYVTVSGGVDGTYGLHQGSEHYDYRDHDHVAAAGREAYRNRKVPRRQATIRIPPDQGLGHAGFGLGDLVQVNFQRGWLAVNRKMRVLGLGYDLDGRNEWMRVDLDSIIA